MSVELRTVEPRDLEAFFRYGADPQAVRMAAFTAKDPQDRAAFDAHWARILADPSVLARTVTLDGEVVGNVGSFNVEGDREITYWIDRARWGLGLATAALRALLELDPVRPVYGRAAWDNVGSRRVLEKCGFRPFGTERGYANGRDAEIEEAIMVLG